MWRGPTESLSYFLILFVLIPADYICFFVYLNRLQGQIHVCGLWLSGVFCLIELMTIAMCVLPTHQQFTQSCRHPNRPKDNAGLSCPCKVFLSLAFSLRSDFTWSWLRPEDYISLFACLGLFLYVKDLFAPLVTLWQRQYAMFLSQKI